jgi:hypothetical protein
MNLDSLNFLPAMAGLSLAVIGLGTAYTAKLIGYNPLRWMYTVSQASVGLGVVIAVMTFQVDYGFWTAVFLIAGSAIGALIPIPATRPSVDPFTQINTDLDVTTPGQLIDRAAGYQPGTNFDQTY